MVADEHLSDEQLQLYHNHHAPTVELKDFHLHLEWCDYCSRRLVSIVVQEMKRKSQQTGGTGTLPQTDTEPVSEKSTSIEVKSDSPDILSLLQTLPGYTNVRALTQGGMGAVYLAHSTSFNREEVLKVVIPSHRQNSGAMSRFKQEIEVIGRLNHPNIVTPYATYEVGGLLVLSMEYAGENLEQFVKRKESLSVADACRHIIQVAEGLQHAHEKQVVHRDIKPNNILMTQLGNKPMLKIVDFGLGKAWAEDLESRLISGGLTPDGTGMGIPAYMSPEQARDSKNADIRTDIYALGCTLYFLLTKQPPFQKDSLAGYLFAHAQDEPPLLHELRADIPVELSQIALKMLAKDPQKRYQTPAEIIRELAPFTLSESTIDWKPPAQDEPKRVKSRVPMLVGLLALFIGSIALAASTLLIKTRDGTIELTNLTEGVDVFVDGDVVNLKWAEGKQSAEIRVKPGTHKLEVKQNGVTVLGETISIQQDGRTVVDGKLKPTPPVPPTRIAKLDDIKAPDKKDIKPTPVTEVPNPSPQPLPPRPEFVPLFNGKDLTGWEQLGDEVATWKVVNKVLVGGFPEGVGGNSLLKTVRSDFRNFHLRIVAMKSERWGSRINLFTPPNGPRIGAARFRVSLGSPQNNVDDEFGRLSFMAKGDTTVMPLTNKVKIVEKQWYTLDIVYQQGKRVTVEVNGVKTADVSDQLKGPNLKTDVRLSLGASVARFKSIEIKELP